MPRASVHLQPHVAAGWRIGLNVEGVYASASEHRASSSAPLSHSMIATPT